MQEATSFRRPLVVAVLVLTMAHPARVGVVSGAGQDSTDDPNRRGVPDPCELMVKAKGQASGLHRQCESAGTSGGAARGDFNGDGFADLAVGAPYEDINGVGSGGLVHIIYGSSTGLTAGNARLLDNQVLDSRTFGIDLRAGDHFGSALASGDFNGDTYADLAIGMPDYDVADGSRNDGQVVVIHGSVNGLDPATADDVILRGRNPGARAGAALVWADFNGDGFGDLAVGMPNAPVRGEG